MRPEGTDRRNAVMEACAVGALALLVRLINLDHTAYVDELNHLIAAASLLREGAPLLESGMEYTRARVFTWMVAGGFLLFGENLPAARAPAVIGGTLLVVLVFAWVRVSFGRWEGWTAGILLLLAPQAIYHSQIARFYGYQAFFVVGAALGAYLLASKDRWQARDVLGLGAIGLGCAAGAMAMQITSLVGLAAVGGWLVVVLGVRMVRGQAPVRSSGWIVAAVAAVAVAGGAWLHFSGTWNEAVSGFGHVGLWAEPHQDNLRYYHDHILSHYPLLWAAFPVIALLALRRRPLIASLWLAVFGLILGVHTIAPWKADRYIFYALPFFFALVGVVVGPVLRWVFVELRDGTRPILGRCGGRPASGLAAGLLVISILFAAWSNPAFPYTARMILGSDATWPFPLLYRGESDWRSVGEALDDRLQNAEVVATSTEQKARYFLGRGELIISFNYLGAGSDAQRNPEFTRNDKTGVPVIGRPESIADVVACHRSGLFLIENNHWRRAWAVTDEVADRIEEYTRRIELDPGWRIHGFEWAHGAGFAADECPTSVRVGPASL